MDFDIPENGTLQLYTANETADQNVWFDDFKVTFTPQLIVQENHYYPFGLELAGIRKVGKPEHKFTYMGVEKEESFGLNWMETDWRGYDVVLGRFHAIDKMAESMNAINPYHYSFNNPITLSDPSGLKPTLQNMIQSAWDATPENGSSVTTYISSTLYTLGTDGSHTLTKTFSKKVSIYQTVEKQNIFGSSYLDKELIEEKEDSWAWSINVGIKNNKPRLNYVKEVKTKSHKKAINVEIMGFKNYVWDGDSQASIKDLSIDGLNPKHFKSLLGYYQDLMNQLKSNPEWNPYNQPVYYQDLRNDVAGGIGALNIMSSMRKFYIEKGPHPIITATGWGIVLGNFLGNAYRKYFPHTLFGRSHFLYYNKIEQKAKAIRVTPPAVKSKKELYELLKKD